MVNCFGMKETKQCKVFNFIYSSRYTYFNIIGGGAERERKKEIKKEGLCEYDCGAFERSYFRASA